MFDPVIQRTLSKREDILAEERERQAKREKRAERDCARMLWSARLYAASDPSDPFAMMRCVSHIRSGVASVYRPSNRDVGVNEDGPGFYRADRDTEKRWVQTTRGMEEIDVVVYRNVARP